MVKGIFTSAAGMVPRLTQMDTIADNMANVSTTGFKQRSVFLRTFIDATMALDRAMGQERTTAPEEVWTDFSQGTFQQTGGEFDFAINGPGFFKVRDAQGVEFYTRDGRFLRDVNGFLITNSGMNLLDRLGNPVRVMGEDISVNAYGDIMVDGEVTTTVGLVDVAAADYPQLQSVGMGLFDKPAAVAEQQAPQSSVILQGFVEEANVNPVIGMVDMIEVFRAFELGQKAIQMQDQSLQRVVTEVGVVR